LRNLNILILSVVAGTLCDHRAAAQQAAPETPAVAAAAPASLVARNPGVTSNRTVSPTAPSNAAARPDTTKVVQIYGGAGYFDLALAEKLRPRLVKGLASTSSNSLPAPRAAISVPAKADGPKKETEVSNL
jgi:hypothetical protein